LLLFAVLCLGVALAAEQVVSAVAYVDESIPPKRGSERSTLLGLALFPMPTSSGPAALKANISLLAIPTSKVGPRPKNFPNSTFIPRLKAFFVDDGVAYFLAYLSCNYNDADCAKWAANGGNIWRFVAVQFMNQRVYVAPKVLWDVPILTLKLATAVIVSSDSFFILDETEGLLKKIAIANGLAKIVNVQAVPGLLSNHPPFVIRRAGAWPQIGIWTKIGLVTASTYDSKITNRPRAFVPNLGTSDPRYYVYSQSHTAIQNSFFVANSSGCNNCVPPSSLWRVDNVLFTAQLIQKTPGRQWGQGCPGLPCVLGSGMVALPSRNGILPWLTAGNDPTLIELTLWTSPTPRSITVTSTQPHTPPTVIKAWEFMIEYPPVK